MLPIEFRLSVYRLGHYLPHPLSHSPAKHLKDRLLRQPYPGLFCRTEDLGHDDQAKRYRHLWERAWIELKPTAVFCVEGWPTIYFRQVAKRSVSNEYVWQRKLWNLGHATTLVVFDDKETRIYSGLATPTNEPSKDFRRVGGTLETAAFADELVERLYAFQSGADA